MINAKQSRISHTSISNASSEKRQNSHFPPYLMKSIEYSPIFNLEQDLFTIYIQSLHTAQGGNSRVNNFFGH